MRKLVLAIGIVLALSGGAQETRTAQAEISGTPRVKTCDLKEIRTGIKFYREATWKHQDNLGIPRTKFSRERIKSCNYALWVGDLWRERVAKWHAKYEAHVKFVKSLNWNPVAAIRYVFGPHGDAAVSVADCETGGTFHVGAENGQYLGLFQMGSSERATYGHGSTALEQARAAYRYFIASGSDWSPWQCQPGGGLQW